MPSENLAEHLAAYYIRAVQDLGITVPDDAEGFDRLFEDGSLRREIRYQIISMDSSSNESPGYVVQKLLQDAVIQYQDRKQRAREIEAISHTADFFRTHFAAQEMLWKRMVGATHEGRLFTDVELECYNRLIKRKKKDLRAARANAGPDIERAAQALVDRELFRAHGLFFDRQMVADVQHLVGNVVQARHTLLVGDKGIAKTQLARYTASLYEHEPIVVSLKGDTTTSDLIGLRASTEDAAAYPEGPVPYALRNGYPLILDEVNFASQAIIARLHDILLRRPGDAVFFPELGKEIEVHPGFVVFATANEASSRYRQRQTLDPAFRDRFDIIVRTYPDLDEEVASKRHPTLTRMALANAVDEEGIFSRHVDPEMLGYLTDVAAISQRLYVLESRRVAKHLKDKGLLEGIAPDQPLIEECISPRSVCTIVEDSALGSLPGRNLDRYLIDRIVSTLDQDGTRHNSDTVRTVALQAGINLFEEVEPEDDEPDEDIDEW